MSYAYFLGGPIEFLIKIVHFKLAYSKYWIEERYFSTSAVKLRIKLLGNEMLNPPPCETSATMNLGKVGFGPSFYRINLGLK